MARRRRWGDQNSGFRILAYPHNTVASVRQLSVCATGRPSLPRALDLGATHDLFVPLRDACCRPVGEPCAFLAHNRLAHNNWTVCRGPCRQPAATYPDLRLLRTTRPRFAGAQRMSPPFGSRGLNLGRDASLSPWARSGKLGLLNLDVHPPSRPSAPRSRTSNGFRWRTVSDPAYGSLT